MATVKIVVSKRVSLLRGNPPTPKEDLQQNKKAVYHLPRPTYIQIYIYIIYIYIYVLCVCVFEGTALAVASKGRQNEPSFGRTL